MTTLKEEEPFAAAVKTVCLDTTCSHCFFNDGSDPAFRPPENVVHKCLGCHTVSYCDRKCQKSDWANHKNECRLLKQLNEKMKPIPEADVRLVARILLKSDEELATKAFNGCTWDSLENHATSGSPEFRNKIDSIIDFIKPLKTLSSEEVTKAFCKVATNRLDIIESRHGIGHVGIGIYLGLSVHKHNCLPDAQVIFNGTTALLRPFDEDPDYSTELTICRYSVTPWTPNRKDKLKNICFYECTCPLCTDDNHIVNRMGSSCHVSCCENAAGILDEIHPFPYRKSVDLSRRAGATSFPFLEHGGIGWRLLAEDMGGSDGQVQLSGAQSTKEELNCELDESEKNIDRTRWRISRESMRTLPVLTDATSPAKSLKAKLWFCRGQFHVLQSAFAFICHQYFRLPVFHYHYQKFIDFLAARSAFFAALFTSNFKEKNAERIVIDANSLAFQRLLSILYNSSCDCENLFDCNAYKKLLIRPSELNRRLWNEVEELFELADRFLVLDLVRGVFETHLIVADLKCPNARPDCYHCAMKLLVALRFNLEEYKKLNVSARMTIKEALVRLNVIVKEHPWSTDAMIWLMDRK